MTVPMTLPTSSPRAESIDASGIDSFLDAASAAGIELHSLQVARHGRVVAAGAWAPYRLDGVHLGYSLSKSITATAVATLIDRGELALADRVVDVLPVGGSEIDPRWNAVEVQHCLSMTVGHTEDAWMAVMRRATATATGGATGFLEAAMATGPDAPPGTVFCYNQVATYVLSRVVAHVTGRHLLDVLRERIFDPLDVGEVLWHRCPDGFELGFSGCHLRPVDLMSLTQLWLDRGQRDGRQLVSSDWFDRAAQPFLPMAPNDVSDWEQGYGFSYWKSRHGHRADGAYGQYGIILPEQDMAIAVNSEVEDMQLVLDLIWQHVLPAVDRPGSPAADDALAARLAALAVPALDGDGSGRDRLDAGIGAGSDLPASYSGLSVVRTGSGFDLTIVVDGTDVTIPCGAGSWATGQFTAGAAMLPVSASAGWRDGRFRAAVRFVETPHTLTIDIGPDAGSAATATWTRIPLSGPDPRAFAARPAP